MFRFLTLMIFAVTMALPPSIHAMGGSETAPDVRAGPDFNAGKQAIDKKEWARAIDLFSKAAAKDPRNADIQNYLGYAYRNSGQMEPAFRHYEQALSLNPRHRGAHEYVGEAYLLTNNLPKAEEHLAALERLCGSRCEEYTELKEKVAEFKNKAK